MLPLLKIFSLLIRVLTRPVVNYTKKIHLGRKKEKHSYSHEFFIWLGNYYNKVETHINRRFLRLADKSNFFIKPLSEDIAIEKGVEFFYELIAYGLLITLPTYEMWVAYVEAQEKSAKQNERLKKMEDNIEAAHKKNDELAQEIAGKLNSLEELIKSLQLTSETGNTKNSEQLQVIQRQIGEDKEYVIKFDSEIKKLRRDLDKKMMEFATENKNISRLDEVTKSVEGL
jgi:hypothetical protein